MFAIVPFQMITFIQEISSIDVPHHIVDRALANGKLHQRYAEASEVATILIHDKLYGLHKTPLLHNVERKD